MKFRLFIIFILIFAIVFGLLSSRYIFAYIKFWTHRPAMAALPQLPISVDKSKAPLPDRARLSIEKLGVSAPIVFKISDDPDTIFKNLENGVVHYSPTMKPGENGMAVILGHSSAYPWYKGGYGSVFALIGELQPGDTFSVRYSDGRTFTYRVRKAVVFNPLVSNTNLDELQTDQPSVVLVSCWPIGTNHRRIAVQAVQEEV